MNGPPDLAVGHRRFEIAAVLVIVAGYVLFQRWIADRSYFILPALAIIGVYLGLSISRSGRSLADFGIGRHNLRPCTLWVSVVVAGTLIAGILVAARNGARAAPEFWMVLAVYPMWGLAQQFVFQGFFHENLIRLGAGWWSVPLTAVVFTAVHFPSVRLMGFAAAGGLIFSALYRHYRNIIPLGIAHGLCGAIIYHLIFQRDLVERFLSPP
jgi:uncharacterized protein